MSLFGWSEMSPTMPETRYSFQIEIDYQHDVDNLFVQLINNWTGEIIASGTATKTERQCVLNVIDIMLKEHLPACK